MDLFTSCLYKQIYLVNIIPKIVYKRNIKSKEPELPNLRFNAFPQ